VCCRPAPRRCAKSAAATRPAALRSRWSLSARRRSHWSWRTPARSQLWPWTRRCRRRRRPALVRLAMANASAAANLRAMALATGAARTRHAAQPHHRWAPEACQLFGHPALSHSWLAPASRCLRVRLDAWVSHCVPAPGVLTAERREGRAGRGCNDCGWCRPPRRDATADDTTQQRKRT
jgi:hypothetical protein